MSHDPFPPPPPLPPHPAAPQKPRNRRTWLIGGSAVIVLAGTIGGVTAFALAGHDDRDKASASRSTTPPPATAAPEPTRVARADVMVEGSWNLEGSLLVQRNWGRTSIFDPDSGGPVAISAAELLPGQEVTDEDWAVAGPVDDPVLVGLVGTRTPSAGLDPEQFVTHLIYVDPETVSITKGVRIDSTDEDEFTDGIHGSVDGVTFQTSRSTGDPDSYATKTTVFGYDLAGNQVWTADGTTTAWTPDLVIVTKVTDAEKDCTISTGHRIGSGEQVLSFETGTHEVYGRQRCWGAEWDTIGGALQLWSPKDGIQYRLWDGRTGRSLALPPSITSDEADVWASDRFSFYDLEEELFAHQRRDADGPYGVDVYDTTTGTSLYSLSGERLQALDGRLVGLSQREIWLITTDEEPIRVNIDTENVDRGPVEAEPVGPVAGAWILYSDNTLRDDLTRDPS